MVRSKRIERSDLSSAMKFQFGKPASYCHLSNINKALSALTINDALNLYAFTQANFSLINQVEYRSSKTNYKWHRSVVCKPGCPSLQIQSLNW